MNPIYVIAGHLQRNILLPAFGQPLIDVPGGDPLYAAAGLLVWDQGVGVLARAGEDYPQEWLRSFEQYGLDTRGIHILPELLDLRNFLAYTDQFVLQQNNPLAHFARLGLPFPKILLGYKPPAPVNSLQTEVAAGSPRPGDVPPAYLDVTCVHLCGLEYPTASRLVSVFREARATTLTLEPRADWMQPTNWEAINLVLHGLSAFMPSEEDLRTLFRGKSTDLVEMAEAIAGQGCELVVIKRGVQGQILYDGSAHKCWQIPAYPVQPVDPTGVGASFCGGFLAGYHLTYDPLQAVLHGNISASLAIEGCGAFHATQAAPGLAKARLESIQDRVREM
jgi:hypothetical protein